MSALPRAVQAQLDAADRIMNGEAAPPESPVEPTPPANEPPPPQSVVPAPAPAEPQPAPQPVESPQDAAYWRARFETMQGKYNAEIPRMSTALQDAQQQLAHMRGQLETITTRQATPSAPPPAALVTETDVEKFGADLVDLVRRVAREERRTVEQLLGQVDQRLRQIAPQLERVSKVEQEVGKTREMAFSESLAREVPDWQAVNTDQRFLAWLDEYDPVAGKTRQQSLDEGAAAFDARRVIGLFKLFKAAVQPVAAPAAAAAPAAPAHQSPQAKAQSELARQVAPSRSATTTVAPQGEKTYTSADYQYWLDYRRVHDTPKEKLEQMLAEMERALAEGRVKF